MESVNDLRQAGFSDAEIMDHVVPQLKGAGFSDQEVYEHLVTNKVPVDPYTGNLIPSIKEVPTPGLSTQIIDTVRDYLGIKPPRTTPLDITAIEQGVSNYQVREEIFGGAAADEFQKVMGRFLAGASFGATDLIDTVVKGEPDRPETMVGTGLGAAAELAGFLTGPFSVVGKITGSWLKPTVGGLRGTAEIMAKGGATLGIASGLSSIIPAFLENENFSNMAVQVAKSTGMGTIIGALYPLAGYVPTVPLKIATTMAVMDLMRSGHGNWFTIDDTIKGIADGSIDKNVLAERSVGYLMDMYFAIKAKPLREQLEMLKENAVVKEILNLTPDEVETVITELGERKLMPGARPPRQEGAKSEILSAVIRNGGINPDFAQGETDRFTPKESRYPRLVSRKGLTPDLMREKLQEEGWLPEGSTPNDMYALMDNELRWYQNMKEVVKRGVAGGGLPPAEVPGIPAKRYVVTTSAGDVFATDEPYAKGQPTSETAVATNVIEVPAIPTEESPARDQALAENAKALGEPIPEEAMKSPEVAQNVVEAGAMEAQAETQDLFGEKPILTDEKGDMRMPQPTIDIIKNILHNTGIKDKDPDGITINDKDLIEIFKYLQMPQDIGMTHPEFAPVWQLERGRETMKAVLDQEYAEATKPFFELSAEERKRVSDALIESEAQDIDFDTVALEKLGLNEKEIKGYRVMKDNLFEAGNLILETMRDFEAPDETIAEFEKQMKNYVPHKWYGNWVVRVVDKNGRTKDMSGVNYIERYRERDRLKAIYPDMDVIVQKRTQVPYEAYQEAPAYAVRKMVDLAMERAGVAEGMQDAMKQALSDLYKSKGFGMHFIKRKNVPGWEEDLTNPLAEYFSGLTGYITKMMFVKQVPEAMRGINPNRKPNLYRYAMDYVRYVTGNVKEFKTAKNIAYFYYLWGNVKSAGMNLTQNFILGWPVLSKQTDFALPKMMSAMARTALGELTAGERGFINILTKGGYLEPKMAQEISGWMGHPIFKGVQGKIGKVVQALDVFRHMEHFNRTSMAVAIYDAGIHEPDKAAQMIEEAHFRYAKGNRVVAARGPLSPVMVFRSWFINYMTWLKNQAKAGDIAPAAKSIFALILCGGLSALPVYKKVREGYIKIFGKDPETEAAHYLGKRFGQTLMKGVPSQIGVDFSGSVGFGRYPADKSQRTRRCLCRYSYASNQGK